MKIMLEKGVWLASGDDGDPPRTTVEENALEFETMAEARVALTFARKYRPFKMAVIQEDLI